MTLPASCDVLVVGAGPAGSACAQMLARAGLQVCLVDQQPFPREKVCGDGLIPDAHAALARLGVAETVAARAHPVERVACIGPRGGRVEVPGRLAVLPRRELDQILLDAAVAAGADFQAPWRFEGLLTDAQGRAQGATLRQGDAVHEVSARWVVLATGAVPQALLAAGCAVGACPAAWRCGLHPPSRHGRAPAGHGGGLAPQPAAGLRLDLPRPGRGVQHRRGHRPQPPHPGRWAQRQAGREPACGVRRLLPPPPERARAGAGRRVGGRAQGRAAALHAGRRALERTGRAGGRRSRGQHLFLHRRGHRQGAGDRHAGGRGPGGRRPEAQVRERYEAALSALKPRFDLYEKANRINAHPWLADLVIWRARHSAGLRRRMAGVLEETTNPAKLVSAGGLLRLLMPMR
jgi:hypothetical protein